MNPIELELKKPCSLAQQTTSAAADGPNGPVRRRSSRAAPSVELKRGVWLVPAD